MALSRKCDSCGADLYSGTITQVIMSGNGQVAGAMLDLCSACSDNVVKDTKVKKAYENFMKRMAAQAPPPSPSKPTPTQG